MTDFPISGSQNYIQYGKEATYASVATTTTAFGHNTTVTNDTSMNETPVYGLGSPYASKTYAGLFEGKLTINFDMASTYFWEIIMGNCTDANDGTYGYSHTYVDNTGYAVSSFSVEDGSDLDEDVVIKYLGCVIDNAEMTFKVGETTPVTLNCLYATETKANTGIDTTPAADAEELLIFSEGSIQLPSGTTLARVQGGSLRTLKNAQLVWGLGSRIASKAIWKTMIFETDIDLAFENDALLETFYGQATGPLTATNPAGAASLIFTWSNAAAGDLRRSLTITLSTTQIVSYSVPKKIGEMTVLSVKCFSIGAPTSIIGIDNTTVNPL